MEAVVPPPCPAPRHPRLLPPFSVTLQAAFCITHPGPRTWPLDTSPCSGETPLQALPPTLRLLTEASLRPSQHSPSTKLHVPKPQGFPLHLQSCPHCHCDLSASAPDNLNRWATVARGQPGGGAEAKWHQQLLREKKGTQWAPH